MADVLSELEASAKILLAPPNVVSNFERQRAESIFISFKKTKTPFVLCRHIFENSKVEYVLYQSASLLKEALIREWCLISKSDIRSLLQYLLQYVLSTTDLPVCVREQILQVIAILVKRSTIDGNADDKELVLVEVSRLINGGNSDTQTIGCSILTALLNEYASTTKSSDVGLTWEVHFHAKKSFEVSDLKRIFQFCLHALFEFEKCDHPTGEFLLLLNRFLMITEQVLSWNFIYINLPKKLVGVFESDHSPSFRPGSTWRDILMDKNVWELFFKIHWKIQSHPELVNHSINSLIQLATLNGTVFPSSDLRLQYLSAFIQGLLKLMRSCVSDQEALGIANILNKLVIYFPPTILANISAELLEEFLNELTKLTCKFLQRAAQDEAFKEDRYYSEAFDRLLDVWVTLLRDSQLFPLNFCKQASAEILNAYLQCHLAPPEGIRSQLPASEVDEVEESDRVQFRDQLSVISMFGRNSLELTIPLLIRLTESRIHLLEVRLQEIHQQTTTQLDSVSMLHNLFEDIHWLILITGYTLCQDQDGETPLIPSEIMHYSISQRSIVNVEHTLKLLISPTFRDNLDQNTDHIVRLIACVFWLSDIEMRAIRANMMYALSPELASTVVWFFRRWTLSYLLPNETYYSEISPALNSAFGRDSETSVWCLNTLLDKVECNLSVWNAEEKVVNDTVQLLVALVDNRERGSCVAKCESMWRLIQKQTSHALYLLPTEAKRGFIKALVLAGTVATDDDTREQYWIQVLKPLRDKYKDLICQENFARIYHEEAVKKEILHLLDCFTGVVQGCRSQNVKLLFAFLYPVISEFVSLLNIYHNYQNVIEQIFHFFCECTKRMLCFLSSADSKSLYECCLSIIQTYAKFNAGKESNSASAEEDQYEDILLLMELLTNLLSKDFIDFSPAENDQCVLSAADVALCGLNIIMPMMSGDILKFPRLCVQYFKMITFVCEIYPEKICQLPEKLFKELIASIQLALADFGTNIMTLCFDFLSGLGSHMIKINLRNYIYWSIQPFLKIILNIVLLQNFDFDLLQTASGTLFLLICLYQDHYQELMNNLLQEQSDTVSYQRLGNAFSSLLTGIQLTDDRANKVKFRENFEKFVTEVRGFLSIK